MENQALGENESTRGPSIHDLCRKVWLYRMWINMEASYMWFLTLFSLVLIICKIFKLH